MFNNPYLKKEFDFNDPEKRKAFEDSYRGTVGADARSPLAQDTDGNFYFNGFTDAANRNSVDAQNDSEAPYKAIAKKSAIARSAYDQTTADIQGLTTSGYDWIQRMFGDSLSSIGKL